MLRIMLPLAAVVNIGVPIDVGVLVPIIHVLVVDVDIDITVTPSTAPTPAATPGSSKGDTGAEGKSTVVRRVDNWWIRINRRTVNNRGIVSGNINNSGIGRLDDDDLFALNAFGLDLLLLTRF